jgi:hypothetical protein
MCEVMMSLDHTVPLLYEQQLVSCFSVPRILINPDSHHSNKSKFDSGGNQEDIEFW